jgi:geranylgeranyl diphosphate synthase type I
VLPAAVGTELGHIASLVHDDIIDGDHLRRGQAAVHSAYGVPLAILTGDLFVFQMFASYTECAERGASAERTLRAVRILSETCVEVCRGQALEAQLAGAVDTRESMYFEVVRLKTASVCRAAAEIGATLGGGNARAVHALRGYGEALGVAFQILDDVLEYAGETDQLGKPVDSDLRNGRVTLPLIYALNDGYTRPAVLRLMARSSNAHAPLARLLEEHGLLARARRTAETFTSTAQAHLDRLPRSDARERLRSYARELLERDR